MMLRLSGPTAGREGLDDRAVKASFKQSKRGHTGQGRLHREEESGGTRIQSNERLRLEGRLEGVRRRVFELDSLTLHEQSVQ